MKRFALLPTALAAPCALALPRPTSAAFDKGELFTVSGYTGSTALSGFTSPCESAGIRRPVSPAPTCIRRQTTASRLSARLRLSRSWRLSPGIRQ